MANIKTAISIDKPIFEQADALAKQMNISRSRLFVLAVQDFIQRHRNLELLDAINQAYEDIPDSEPGIVDRMRSKHHEMVKDQW